MHPTYRWLVPVAAVAVTILAFLVSRKPATRDPLQILQNDDSRSTQARLTLLAYAPYRVARGASAGNDLQRLTAAAELQRDLTVARTPMALQRAATAEFVLGHHAAAVQFLEEALTATPRDAALVSDLAAVRFAAGDLLDAAESAIFARELDPRSPQAAFNRALTMQSIASRTSAARAWADYLELDPASPWAAEAHTHLSSLEREDPVADWHAAREQLTPEIDDETLRTIVRNYPQRVRYWVQDELLPRWAASGKDDDIALALRIAKGRGDAFLLDVVRHAAARPADVRAALKRFGIARTITPQQGLVKAERELETSLELLRETRSPLAVPAAVFLASNQFYRGDSTGALRTLDRAATWIGAREEQYAAAAAHIHWVRALVFSSLGQPNESLRAYRHALSLASRARETEDEIALASQLAAVLDQAGSGDEAARFRIEALRKLEATGGEGQRAYNVYLQATYAELRAGRPRLALAYNATQAALAATLDDPLLKAESSVTRALALRDSGKTADARASSQVARAHAMTVANAAMRDRVVAEVDYVEGAMARRTDARGAVALLDAALATYERYGWRNRTALAHLARAEARLVLGDDAGAEADLRRGIGEVERQRATLQEPVLRVAYFERADDLFERLIELLLRQRRESEAFAVAERKRGRTMLDELSVDGGITNPLGTADIVRDAPPDTMLVEYTVLDDSLVIFVVARHQLFVTRVAVARTALERAVRDVVEAIASDDRVFLRRAGGALHELLIAPVDTLVSDVANIVFIPDAVLHSVPFAALITRDGRYVIEQRTVRMAPSVSIFLDASHRPRERRSMLAIAVENPSPALRRLDRVVDETRDVAAGYRSAMVLEGRDAQPQAVLSALDDADVVHFAGHAISAGPSAPSALALADSTILEAQAISRQELRKSPLVVLAACSSGRGRIWKNEGIGSLATAFLQAGASGVIANLWDIEDEPAARLSREIHRNLQQGAGASDALRAAQLAMLRSMNPADRRPSSWAGAFLVGSM